MLSHLGELKKYLKKSFLFGKKHAMLNTQLQVILLISKWQVFVRANEIHVVLRNCGKIII